ncbi:MAG TPA: hypothetical protein VK067_01250 [Pseudogracilibacillus sp.]|nr:hypothetical protein [Pseudogracilibacillus sp.]
MKKQFYIMKNDRGFFFPYVVVIATILLISVSTTIYLYKNEQRVTENLVKQVKTETVFQMARAKFMEEKVYENHSTGELLYVFPDGEVEVVFEYVTDTEIQIDYWIILGENAKILYNHTVVLEAKD